MPDKVVEEACCVRLEKCSCECIPASCHQHSCSYKESEAWKVKGSFRFTGGLANWFVCQRQPWIFTINAESIGPGPEKKIGSKSGKTEPGKLDYEVEIDVPAHTLTAEEEGGTVYKLVCTVVIQATDGCVPPGIVCSFEGTTVHIYPE